MFFFVSSTVDKPLRKGYLTVKQPFRNQNQEQDKDKEQNQKQDMGGARSKKTDRLPATIFTHDTFV